MGACWHSRLPIHRFYTFQTLIILSILFVGFSFEGYPPCDGVVKVFRGIHDIRTCACPNDTSEFYYYHCQTSSDSCFRCLLDPSITIPASAVCDNVVDCPDLTDELMCEHVELPSISGCRRIEDNMIEKLNPYVSKGKINCVCRIFDSGQFFLAYNGDIRKTTIARHDVEVKDSLEPICNCSISDVTDSKFPSCYSMSEGQIAKYLYSDVQTPQVTIGFIISTVAILGNIGAIFMTAKNIHTKHARLSPEEKLTKYLFLSLSISDMIVAMCTFFFCVHLQFLKGSDWDADNDGNCWEIPYCSANGALAVIGTEQSVFTMVLITMSRIWGVARPFSRIPIRAFVILLFVSWAVSVLIASIPLMSVFEDTFLKDIIQTDAPLLPMVLQDDVDDVTSFLRQYSKTSDYARPSGAVADLRFLIKELFNIKNIYYVGYYQGLYSCLPDIYPRRDSVSLLQFNMVLFCLNSFCYIFMLVGYVYIYVKHGFDRRRVTVVPADTESRNLKRKIFYILATNFVCWLPVCAFGIGHVIHSSIQSNSCHLSKSDHRTISLIAILVVMPINGALNPFLYTAAPEYLNQKVILLFKRLKKNHSSDRNT